MRFFFNFMFVPKIWTSYLVQGILQLRAWALMRGHFGIDRSHFHLKAFAKNGGIPLFLSLRNSKVVSTALGAQKLKYLLAVKDNKNEYTYEQKTLLNPDGTSESFLRKWNLPARFHCYHWSRQITRVIDVIIQTQFSPNRSKNGGKLGIWLIWASLLDEELRKQPCVTTFCKSWGREVTP